MGKILLGIGDYGASCTPGDTVKTLALGSCVAIVLLAPKTRTIGMVHVALPDSTIDLEKAKKKPGYFADTGLPALLQEMKRIGGEDNIKQMYIKLAGGANVLGSNTTFDIGKRNVLAIKKLLWQYGTGAVAEDVEGHISRTVSVDVDTGVIELYCPGRDKWTI